MNYLRFTQYAYLIAGVLVAIESYNQYQAGNTNKAIIMGIFTLVAVFMFFFRKNYAKKFQERNKKP
jgi:positive regulator of sigma E activity